MNISNEEHTKFYAKRKTIKNWEFKKMKNKPETGKQKTKT